jgi:hypothetical protein
MPTNTHVTWRRSLSAAVAVAAALVTALGCSSGYDIPSNGVVPKGDADCMADMEPSQGDVCTRDCLDATCASGMGRRVCTCEGGVFLQCACLPPAYWPYKEVPTAPYCDPLTGDVRVLAGETCSATACRSAANPMLGCECLQGVWQCGSAAAIAAEAPSCESFGRGLQATLKNRPCDNEWQLCIARDYNPEGTSPRGCVCMKDDPTSVDPNAPKTWTCGATNRWWRAE